MLRPPFQGKTFPHVVCQTFPALFLFDCVTPAIRRGEITPVVLTYNDRHSRLASSLWRRPQCRGRIFALPMQGSFRPKCVMAALLVHIGVDERYRVPVFRRAGYSVKECHTVEALHSTLLQFPNPDVVAVAEREEIDAREVASVVRSRCASPLVLFQKEHPFLETSKFDLVIPFLTDRRVWLRAIAAEVARSRILCRQARRLCDEAAAVVERSLDEVERAAQHQSQAELYSQVLDRLGWGGPRRGAAKRRGALAGELQKPELVIGHDENYRAVTAVCSACGEELSGSEPLAATTDEAIRWFSARFASHVQSKHR
jgi:hypothetical protein